MSPRSALWLCLALAACSVDGGTDGSSYFADLMGSGYPRDPQNGPATTLPRDAGNVALDAGHDSTTGPTPVIEDAGSGSSEDASIGVPADPAALVPRGRYLVHHVAACPECHTPRNAIGQIDESLSLSGVECFRDSMPDTNGMGCIHTGNLTHHETGLKNRSDGDIKAMFLEGMRPNGKALHPTMPYWAFGNMSNTDADAIVAYLRTVAPVDHMVPPNEAPFDAVTSPEPRWPADTLPTPRADYTDQAAAERGAYLASSLGACIDCHTPKASGSSPDRSRAYRGGQELQRSVLGLPAAFFPPVIRTANLTSHADGLAGWTVQEVVTALKDGKDRDGASLCPPMPGGMGAFGGMTQADAEDIAHYVLSLEPGEGKVVDECTAPF